MQIALNLIAALVLIVLVSRNPNWAVLVAAVALPLTQSLPGTGIPGLNVMNLLIVCMGVGLLARRSDPGGRALPLDTTMVPLALFSLAALFGWVNAAFIQEVPVVVGRPFTRYGSFLELKEILALGVLMLLTSWGARTAAEVRRHLALVMAGLSVEVMFCVLEWFHGMGRITGHLRQANSLAAFMAIVGSTAAGLYVTIPSRSRWLYFALGAGAVFSGIMSRSRGGLLALFLSLLVITLFRKRWLFILLVILGFSYRLWLPDVVIQRMDQSYVVDESGTIEAADTAAQRLAIWRAAEKMIPDHPLGVGLGAFSHFAAQYGTAADMNAPNKSAHNEFVGITAELGPLGLGCFVLLLGSLAISSWRCYRNGRSTELGPVGMAGLSALVGIILANLTGTFFFQGAISGHFWMIMGLASKGDRLLRSTKSASSDREASLRERSG